MNVLLTKAGIKPPYILVGHSWGGFVARTYVNLYPKNVAGIIFVSSAVEDEYLWINGKIVTPRLMTAEEWDKLTNKAMRDKDTTDPDKILYQIPKPEKLDAPFDKLPDSIQQIRIWAMLKPVTKRLSEGGDVNDFRSDFMEVHQTTLGKKLPLGSLPLIVLTDQLPYDPKNEDGYSKEQYDWNNNLQEKLSKLSADGIEIITTKSDHYIQLSQSQLVIGAINEMKNAIKFHKKISDKKIRAHLTKLAKE
jgi:pimeloyl-ACP methyl ester carboxylesterase